jgi:serine/threonine protein phosphatase PrpC
VDDSLSGTTAVGVYMHGRDIWVANVGDSRAIVCQVLYTTLYYNILNNYHI